MRVFLAVLFLLLVLVPARAQPTTTLVPGKWAVSDQVCGSASSSCVVKTSAGWLYTVYANCTSACWLMMFNRTSAPSDGATTAGTGRTANALVECFNIASGDSKSVSYLPYSMFFSVGMVAMISSTACATLTASGVGYVKATFQ